MGWDVGLPMTLLSIISRQTIAMRNLWLIPSQGLLSLGHAWLGESLLWE